MTPNDSASRPPALEVLASATLDETDRPALQIDPAAERIRGTNTAFLDTYEWPRQNLLDSDYRVCLHPDDWDPVARVLALLAQGRPVHPIVVRVCTFDGRVTRRPWAGVPRLRAEAGSLVTLVERAWASTGAIPPSDEARGTRSAGVKVLSGERTTLRGGTPRRRDPR